MSERIPGWLERLSSEAKRLSADVERKVREAADSPAGQELRKAVQDLGPQVRKAVDEVAPRVKSAYGQVAPEVRKVYEQVAPEVKKAVDEVGRVTSKAVNDLVGRGPQGSGSAPHADAGDAPPNISPDAYRKPSRPEPLTRDELGAEVDDDAEDTPVDPPSAKPKSKPSARRPRKPSGGKGK